MHREMSSFKDLGADNVKTYRTEFPVRADIAAREFLATAIHWINGIASSKLDFSLVDSEGEDSVYALSSDANEEFKCIRVPDLQHPKFGFSYRTKQTDGLVYETELTYTSQEGAGFVLVKASCLSLHPEVYAHTPLKPAVIKLAIERGWSDVDNPLHARIAPSEIVSCNALDLLVDREDPSGLPWVILISDAK